MSTSNSTDWSLTRLQVVTASLRKLGVLASGEVASTNANSDGQQALNAIVKAFVADGMPLWKIASQSFTVVSGTSSYTVGPSLTINCPKPLKIIQAFYTPSGGTQTPMTVQNRYDFNNLPTGTTGEPLFLNYQPLRTSGTIKLWPTPDNSTTSVTFHYQSPYEDMDDDANDFDFPPEWMQALIYTLAWTLAPEYGIPPTDRGILQKEAEYWHQYALSLGSEEGGIFFQPQTRF